MSRMIPFASISFLAMIAIRMSGLRHRPDRQADRDERGFPVACRVEDQAAWLLGGGSDETAVERLQLLISSPK
jgi:hypothetical protein